MPSILLLPLLSALTLAISVTNEKNRLIEMLRPLSDIIDRMAAHNQWHYEKDGRCDTFGIDSNDVVMPVEEATRGILSGNLVDYIFTDYDDCKMYVQFKNAQLSDNTGGKSYEYRLHNLMLVFTPIMDHTINGRTQLYDRCVHGDEPDLYTISDWTCSMVHSYVVLTESSPEPIYDADIMQNLTPVQAQTSYNSFTILPIYRGSAKQPNPFTYMKTIGGQTTLVNFSHELPGKLMKKFRNLVESS